MSTCVCVVCRYVGYVCVCVCMSLCVCACVCMCMRVHVQTVCVSKCARNSVSLLATIHAVKLHGSLHNTHHLLEEREGIVLLHVEEDRQRTFGGLLELYLYVKPERGEEVHRGTIGMSPCH